MINTLLNAILTPSAVATLPPEVPAIVQTYNWETQTVDGSLGTHSNANLAIATTYCLIALPGKPVLSLHDD